MAYTWQAGKANMCTYDGWTSNTTQTPSSVPKRIARYEEFSQLFHLISCETNEPRPSTTTAPIQPWRTLCLLLSNIWVSRNTLTRQISHSGPTSMARLIFRRSLLGNTQYLQAWIIVTTLGQDCFARWHSYRWTKEDETCRVSWGVTNNPVEINTKMDQRWRVTRGNCYPS